MEIGVGKGSVGVFAWVNVLIGGWSAEQSRSWRNWSNESPWEFISVSMLVANGL